MNPEHESMLKAFIKYLNYFTRLNQENYEYKMEQFTTDKYGHVKELSRYENDWWGKVIVLEVGDGDDGGPSMLIGRFESSIGMDDVETVRLEALSQTFDTMTCQILADGKEVYRAAIG